MVQLKLRVGIVGAGLAGRLLAWQLGRLGHSVTVFDPNPGPLAQSIGVLKYQRVPALGLDETGLLSPIAELEHGRPSLALLGWRSLILWRSIASDLSSNGCTSPLFKQQGSLMLADACNVDLAQRMLNRRDAARARLQGVHQVHTLNRYDLRGLEPAVTTDLHAWLIPEEAYAMSDEMLQALFVQAPNVQWCWCERVKHAGPRRIALADGSVQNFDLAIDVAEVEIQDLMHVRYMRNEVIWLHAPAVTLQRPVRMLQPQRSVHVVPRENGFFIVGASETEENENDSVHAGSAVNLLSAAYRMLPELTNASVVHMHAKTRPVVADDRPRVHHEPGFLRIEGLHRHRWLMAPALIENALNLTELVRMPST